MSRISKVFLFLLGFFVVLFYIAHVTREQAKEREFFTSFGTTTKDPNAQMLVNYELELLANSAEIADKVAFSVRNDEFYAVAESRQIILRRQTELAQKSGFKIPDATKESLSAYGMLR